MPKPYDSKLVWWDDQHVLTASTVHVERIPGCGKGGLAIDPEKSAIDWTLVRRPRWRDRAYKLHIAFGQNALAVPNPILQVKVAEARPVARSEEHTSELQSQSNLVCRL